MLVYAGIDEAGYGPMLGPLCVAATAFELPGTPPTRGAPDLWRLLGQAVCRGKRDRRRRIAVDDSKRLKGANTGGGGHPLKHLERGVLAFLAVDEDEPASSDEHLFARLGVAVDAPPPWYGSTTTLPLAQPADEMRIARSRLRRALDRAGVRCRLIRSEVIDAASFNRSVERMGTKSSVNFGAAMRLVDRVWRTWHDDHPRIIVDRQGGRIRYRPELQMAFPDARLRILAESDALSRYRLDRDGSRLTISFVQESERRHLPVALASMVAKYVRELMMLRLNRFFMEHLPELKPTAGYVEDARRYLRDIEPVIRDLELARDDLVRRV